ncbi:MAG: high-potential iron-sulfur protein [Methylobacteriaceae bacterium]|nr:high-potential iron-sulfur protein [Rhodoblastus sp.]MCC0003762.1 high-potential iron-sulfur protein [Methylobacteriaceae bacterium]
MSNQSKSHTNRRELLALTLGGAALLCLVDTPAYAAKVSKASVRYQNNPKGGSQCSNCKLFIAPNACKSVAGEISPKGWCALWVKA